MTGCLPSWLHKAELTWSHGTTYSPHPVRWSHLRRQQGRGGQTTEKKASMTSSSVPKHTVNGRQNRQSSNCPDSDLLHCQSVCHMAHMHLINSRCTQPERSRKCLPVPCVKFIDYSDSAGSVPCFFSFWYNFKGKDLCVTSLPVYTNLISDSRCFSVP